MRPQQQQNQGEDDDDQHGMGDECGIIIIAGPAWRRPFFLCAALCPLLSLFASVTCAFALCGVVCACVWASAHTHTHHPALCVCRIIPPKETENPNGPQTKEANTRPHSPKQLRCCVCVQRTVVVCHHAMPPCLAVWPLVAFFFCGTTYVVAADDIWIPGTHTHTHPHMLATCGAARAVYHFFGAVMMRRCATAAHHSPQNSTTHSLGGREKGGDERGPSTTKSKQAGVVVLVLRLCCVLRCAGPPPFATLLCRCAFQKPPCVPTYPSCSLPSPLFPPHALPVVVVVCLFVWFVGGEDTKSSCCHRTRTYG